MITWPHLRLPQRAELRKQATAAVGDEMRQRAVLANLHELRLRRLLHAQRVLDGVVGGDRRGALRLVLHAGEEAPAACVVALVARPADGRGKLFHQVDAHIVVPGFQQRERRVAHEPGRLEPRGVLALRAPRLHEDHASRAARRQRDQQALLHASQTGDAHHLRGVVQPVRRGKQLFARDDHLAVGRLAGRAARLQQLGIVWTMRLERAGGAHGGAGAAPDAPLGLDGQLVVVVGDATARAHLGTLHARRVAIAHNSATALMNRDVGALKLFEQTEEISHVSHDFTLSRLPPCTAQYSHFRRSVREKSRLTPFAALPIMWPWGVRRHAGCVRSGHCLQKWEPQG